MPPVSSEEAYGSSDDVDSQREHARTLVKMADMVTRSTEKVERKAEMENYDESALDLMFLDASDASNLDAERASKSDAVIAAGKELSTIGNDEGGGDGGTNDTNAKEGGGDDGSAGGSVKSGKPADGADALPPRTRKANKRGSSKKKESKKREDAAPSSPTIAETSSDDLGVSGLGDNSDASLRDQLTQSRRALLQVRENAKLKHRKLELEHTTVKKELKKAKDVIEKQTVEYKRLKVKLEGVEKERDDAQEELARELGGRGSLVSGISQENGRMIRRLREIRAERDKLEVERDELKQALERCTCDAGKGHEFTLTSSLAHETIPMDKASALSQRHFVTESRRNIFESARSIRSNLSDEMEHEIQATKEEMARRRRGSISGGSVSFSQPARRGQRSYLRPGEEKMAHNDYYDDDDDQSTMSFISMSVRSLPVAAKKKIDNVWSSTSMRLGSEIDPDHSGPGGRLTVEFRNKARSKSRRSYHRHGEGRGDEAGGTNIAPRGEPSTKESSGSDKSFWAATSQRFLMGMAQEVDE